ncbi:type IV pilus modification protein PilV [Alkalilimnicola sp. S0819]|uniref:type IV pilus modification protein PilV n=1 Tax=Alkalilimnicola sp. S0819 TaxID=2613922 RepID=UPI00126195BD|nr:type IV pilus modification protein PilV [Alkalilimnicola sp. S0819]KAB7623155.1 type IV pilus modification protein PilV [Alkalilimnicola sp. S0819]MPQ16999.1 type IV pilus modification protein PilV [Alkalilimnicola sp. S0819]
MRQQRKRQQGLSLIEVLVAVLVLSVGLLGLAGLQAASLKNNHSAYLRSQATILANDMADRMRANRAGFLSGAYDQPAAAQTATCLTTAGCSAANMAAHDAWEWQQAVAAQLPGGNAIVCRDSTLENTATPAAPACDGAGDFYAIKIWWNDERDGSTLLFDTSVRP